MCPGVLLCVAPAHLNWIEFTMELGKIEADMTLTLNQLLKYCMCGVLHTTVCVVCYILLYVWCATSYCMCGVLRTVCVVCYILLYVWRALFEVYG